MDAYGYGYTAGVIAGLLFAFIAGLIIRKVMKKKGKVAKYDERQKYEQARAGYFAFWTTLLLVFLVSVTDSIEAVEINPVTYAVICIVGITVWAGYCIFKEAYFGINQNGLKWNLIFLALAAFNLFVSIKGDLQLNPNLYINIGCAAMCAILPVLSTIKYCINKRAEARLDAEEEDEEQAETAEN